jgi:predicted metal-dependent peptidase
VLEEPFFGSLLLELPMQEDRTVKTFCTNGKVIKYNPEFAASCKMDKLKFVLIHEVLHCALGHVFRRGFRDPQKWNMAADYSIHSFLDEYNNAVSKKRNIKPFPIPEDALFNPAYKDLSSEEVYQMIPDPPQNQGNGNGQGQGSGQGQPQPQQGNGQGQPQQGQGSGSSQGQQPQWGEFEDADTSSGESEDEQEHDWKRKLAQASEVARQRGVGLGNLDGIIKDLLCPPEPWQDLLKSYITEKAKDDYSWVKPNKRFLSQGIVLPSLDSQRMGEIVIAIDTSGSVNPEMLSAFISQIQSILDECMPSKMTIIQCDWNIQKVREYEPGDLISKEYKGGGGTSFKPVFDHIDKHGIDPVCAVYFTDMEGDFPDKQPSYPVLWADYSKRPNKAPFGERIEIK